MSVLSDTLDESSGNTPDYHLSLVFGYKHLDESWAPAQSQAEFGTADFDYGESEWPVHLCAQILLSYSPATPRHPGIRGEYSGAYEINFGIRKIWDPWRRVQLHAGGGVGLFGASTSEWVDGLGFYQRDNKSAVGFWGNAGFYWLFSDAHFGGMAVQYSKANIRLFNQPLGVGGTHLLVYVGWYW